MPCAWGGNAPDHAACSAPASYPGPCLPSLVPCAVNTQRVPHTANGPGKPGSTPPNWRGNCRAQHLGARRTFAQGFLNAWQGRGQRCFIELLSQLIIPGDAHQ